jgi:nitrile hydratase accessory protein
MLSISICGTTILNQPDPIPELGRLAALPRLSQDADGPVFAEPWQAQAFAIAVNLSEQGHFTWKEWAAELADELEAATPRWELDDGSRYYHHWLSALERLITAKGLTDLETLLARKEAWAEAYRRTPHGKSVELTVDFGSAESR